MSREESGRQALSDAWTEIVTGIGLPASSGRIFTALLLSPVPLSQAELRSSLSLSDGSISEGLRLLVERNFVERSGEPRARPAYYQVRASAWSDAAYATLENANATYALANFARQHFEEYGIDGPGLELIVRTQAMFEHFVADLPALVQKAVDAGARARVRQGKRSAAG